MIENSKLKVGGNSFKAWIGQRIESFGSSIMEYGHKILTKNKYKIVTNPSAKLCNPFTLIVSFTVDANQKYQLVLQGDYKEKYKESEDGVVNMSENDMFVIINSMEDSWFKKE